MRLARPGVTQVSELVELLNTSLGAGLYSIEGKLEDLADPGAHLVVAMAGEDVVGAAVARLLVPADLAYYLAFGVPARDAFNGTRVGSIEALAVRPASRRAGIGRALLDDSLAWCELQGCEWVVGVSWISGARGTSAPLFAAAGFNMGPTISEFYREDSVRNGWTCPVCGPVCTCAGQFVYRAAGDALA